MLGLDWRLQTGLSKQHMWDPRTVKSGCFKHTFKIYLHFKKKTTTGREVGVYSKVKIPLLLVVFYISVSLIIPFR